MSYLSANLNMLINAVKKASASLNRDFSEIEKLQSSVRGYKEFVASAIKKVENNLRVELSKSRPSYAFAENNKPQPNGPHFIVSALDGVVNFAHGIPYFAVSVATYENGQITAGVIYNPATEECYFAERGTGAYKEGFRNHERLRVSVRKELGECMVSAKTAPVYDNEHEKDCCRKIQANVIPQFNANRTFGAISLDLAYVAAGKLDAVVSSGNMTTEIAAGMLLVKEAGGSVFDIDQSDIRSENLDTVLRSGDIIACNANIGKKVSDLLNKK